MKGRRRFTVGHELGHFLIPTHKPVQKGNFLCSRGDMRQWSLKDVNAYVTHGGGSESLLGFDIDASAKLRSLMTAFAIRIWRTSRTLLVILTSARSRRRAPMLSTTIGP